MKLKKARLGSIGLILLATVFLLSACQSPTAGENAGTTAPTVISVFPADQETNIAINKSVSASFSTAMDPATLNSSTVTLFQGNNAIPGVVSYIDSILTFKPSSNLALNTTYTATISTGAKNLAGIAMAAAKTWTFSTRTTTTLGPAPVNLGTAGNFAILSKSGISTVPASVITGNIGVSPVAATYITGFSLVMDATNVFASSTQVTGRVYASNYAVPTPANMTTAINDMMTAYTDAAGRKSPDFTELYSGNLSGRTLAPGLYKWGTGILFTTDATLQGGPNDVWIFQVSGDITLAAAAKIQLAGGALAKNIFWQTFGVVKMNTTSHLEGNVLAKTAITLATGASVHGRLLAQTAVALDKNTVTQPAP